MRATQQLRTETKFKVLGSGFSVQKFLSALVFGFWCLVFSARAATNITAFWYFNAISDHPLNVTRFEIRQIARTADYNGTNYFPSPIIVTRATTPSLTNGYFSTNLWSAAAYEITVSDNYATRKQTNVFPDTVTGTVNGSDYQSDELYFEGGLAVRWTYRFPPTNSAYVTNAILTAIPNPFWSASSNTFLTNLAAKILLVNGSGGGTVSNASAPLTISSGSVVFTNETLLNLTNAGTLTYSNAATFVPYVLSVATNAADAAATNAQNGANSFTAGNAALLAGTNNLTGSNTFSGVVSATNANNQFTGTFTGNGAGLNISLATNDNGNTPIFNGETITASSAYDLNDINDITALRVTGDSEEFITVYDLDGNPTSTQINRTNGNITANSFTGNGAGLTNVAGTWSTNSTNIFFNTGKVGIGTNNPQAKLHVYSAIGQLLSMLQMAEPGGGPVDMVKIGWEGKTAAWTLKFVDDSDDAGSSLQLYNSSGVLILNIKTNGNVWVQNGMLDAAKGVYIDGGYLLQCNQLQSTDGSPATNQVDMLNRLLQGGPWRAMDTLICGTNPAYSALLVVETNGVRQSWGVENEAAMYEIEDYDSTSAYARYQTLGVQSWAVGYNSDNDRAITFRAYPLDGVTLKLDTNGTATFGSHAVFLPIAEGPAGITNGRSAVWNSNGYATYLRTSIPESETFSDVLIGIHQSP